MANPPKHATKELFMRLGVPPPAGALSRRPRYQPVPSSYNCLMHPLPYYTMWRGNHAKYTYNKYTVSNWGEGETMKRYHQYFSHAKDPCDVGRSGREFELIKVTQGKMVRKPLPVPQYVLPDSKPKWVFKSWESSFDNLEVWQREVQYQEHVPAHLGCKRPLCVLAPVTFHKYVHMAHIDKVTVTLCPFVFSYGKSLQKTAIDFYRHCLSARCPFPKDRVFLFYALDYMTPQIEVTWVDGTTYNVPLLEGSQCQNIVQLVMERSWLEGDRIDASGRPLQPLPIDDFKWQQLIAFKQKKKAQAAAPAAKK